MANEFFRFIKCFLSSALFFFGEQFFCFRGQGEIKAILIAPTIYIHRSIKVVYVADEFYDGGRWNAFNYI